ncbi:MAG: hypothetical protein AB1796_08560 [Bacillota bacterium]
MYKVKISRPYGDGLMRVWGWVPEEAGVYRDSWNRDKVVATIYNHLNQHYTVQVWREMDSCRDTVMPNTDDAKKFLRSLQALPLHGELHRGPQEPQRDTQSSC